jgi:hypothetical protein
LQQRVPHVFVPLQSSTPSFVSFDCCQIMHWSLQCSLLLCSLELANLCCFTNGRTTSTQLDGTIANEYH